MLVIFFGKVKELSHGCGGWLKRVGAIDLPEMMKDGDWELEGGSCEMCLSSIPKIRYMFFCLLCVAS